MIGHMNMKSIDLVQYGAVDATGIMQTTLTTLYGVKLGTGVLTIPMQTSTKIYNEESPIAFSSINGNREDAKLELHIIGSTMTQMASMFGATYAAATASDPATITFASTDGAVEYAFKVTGRNDRDEDVVIMIPRANILAGIDETITKDDMIGYSLMVEMLQPFVESTGATVVNYLFVTAGTKT